MHLGLSVLSLRKCNLKTTAPIDLIFFTQGLVPPWLGPLRWYGSGSGSGLKNIFKIKICQDVKLALWWRHSLWRHMSVIASEGLSFLFLFTVHYVTMNYLLFVLCCNLVFAPEVKTRLATLGINWLLEWLLRPTNVPAAILLTSLNISRHLRLSVSQ